MVDRTGDGGSSFVCLGIESTLTLAAVLEFLCLNHTHLIRRKMFNALTKSLTEDEEERKVLFFLQI